MPEYHIATSDISGAIYAGIGDKRSDGILWDDKSEVTSEAINAVMAHMLYRISNAKMDDTYDKYSFAYANKTRDGRYLRLKLEVADTKPSWLDEGREKND